MRGWRDAGRDGGAGLARWAPAIPRDARAAAGALSGMLGGGIFRPGESLRELSQPRRFAEEPSGIFLGQAAVCGKVCKKPPAKAVQPQRCWWVGCSLCGKVAPGRAVIELQQLGLAAAGAPGLQRPCWG